MVSQQDRREGFEVFLGDMADTQAEKGKLPEPSANQALAAELFDGMEQRGQFDNIAKPDAPIEPDLDHAVWRIKRTLDADEKVVAVEPLAQRALKRYRYLQTLTESGPLGQPSWAERARRVQEFFVMDRGPSYERQMKRYAFELAKLLGESDRYFGNWKLDFSP